MSYKVTIKNNVTKKLRTVPKEYVPKIYSAMKGLSENPRPTNSKNYKAKMTSIESALVYTDCYMK